MTQSVPMIFSPSSLRMTRSTPWVEGCCGPMLRTSSVESRKVVSGILASLAAFNAQVFPHPALVLLNNGVVLAQRIALPFLGHQDAPQVRVAGELDAEHIECLALQPIGRQVHAHGGFRLVAVGNVSLDPHPLVPGEAIYNVHEVEALGPLGPIHRGDIDQVIEIGFELEVYITAVD